MATSHGGGWTEPARPRVPVALEGRRGARPPPLRAHFLVAVALVTLCCGGARDADGGGEATADPGADVGLLPGHHVDAAYVLGPERLVYGTMTVNGTRHELSTGFAMRSSFSHLLYLGTADDATPRLQVTLMLPVDASPGFDARCGGPWPILFAARWVLPEQVAFFTRNPVCAVALSEVATDVGDDYRGTFSATLDFEPRSALDPGFPVMTITEGSFTVRRPF